VRRSGTREEARERGTREAGVRRARDLMGRASGTAARDLIAAEPERCIGKPVGPDELRARAAAALHRHD